MMEDPVEMDDDWGTPISGNLHMGIYDITRYKVGGLWFNMDVEWITPGKNAKPGIATNARGKDLSTMQCCKYQYAYGAPLLGLALSGIGAHKLAVL